MPRWMRVVRGMLLMGATVGGIAGVLGAAGGLVLWALGLESDPVFGIVAVTTWGFATGAAFSGALALVAGRATFDQLRLPRVAAAGALGGFVLAWIPILGTLGEWSLADASVPLLILPALGAGVASVSLLVARRARPSLEEDGGGVGELGPGGGPEGS